MHCESVRESLQTGYLQWEDLEYLDVARHLAHCADCARTRKGIEDVVRLLQRGDPAAELDLRQLPSLGKHHPRRVPRSLAALAAVIIAGITGFALGRTPVARVTETEPVATSDQPSPTQPTATQAIGRDVAVVRLDDANLRALRVREFAADAQLALFANITGSEVGSVAVLADTRLADLTDEGQVLATECLAAGEPKLADLIDRTVRSLRGGSELDKGKAQRTLEDLGRLRFGLVLPKRDGAAKDNEERDF